MLYICIRKAKQLPIELRKRKQINQFTNLNNLIFMAKNKVILMPYGGVKKVSKSTGLSEPTVRWALRGAIDNENARLIRKRALEMGGTTVR